MSIVSPISFYLITEKLPVVFTGRVNGTPTDPYMTINISSGATGTFGAPLPGMTAAFGSSLGASDRGVQRLRSWSMSQISIGESDDLGPQIQNNDHVTIWAQFRLFPIYPRALQSGTNVTLFEDYDIAYSDQTRLWKPVAVAGPPSVSELGGTTFQARFVGDRSFAVAPGATITSYLWTAPGSVQGSSTSQGTEASPVIFTYTTPGQKLVYLRVTDSNGKTATNYTWAFGIDPNTPTDVAYTDFDSYNDNFDFEQGGGQCSFTVHGGATVADFPNEAMVIMASRPTTPGQTTPTGYWPNRDNVHFVGYILGDTVRQNPVSGDVTFTAATVDALMRNVTMFPVSLTFRSGPTAWTMAANLTPDRAASFLWHYRSTLSLMASLRPSNYTALIQRQDFGPNGGIYGQLDGELLQTMWGKVVANHQGVVHHLIDYNLMLNSERSGVTVRKTLHKGVWVDDVNIEERMAYSQPVNVVKMSGVAYNGGELEDICPLFSESPGNAPKVYGSELNYDRLILTSQADLNTRCGRALAKATPKYPGVSMRFINDGSFTIAPQELFPTNIEAGDNDRGLAFTTRLLPRRISRTFDHQNMLIAYDVGFEPETDGPAGVTVDLPCEPPDQVTNTATSQPPPPRAGTGAAASLGSVIVAWSSPTGNEVAVADIGSIYLNPSTSFEGGTLLSAPCLVGLSSSKGAVLYSLDDADFVGNIRILSVQDKAIQVFAQQGWTNGEGTSKIAAAALTSSLILAVYQQSGQNELSIVPIAIEGSVIDPDDKQEFNTATGLETFSIDRLSANRAIIVWIDSNGVRGRVSDGDGVAGSTILINSALGSSNACSVVALNSSTAIVVYRADGFIFARLLYNITATSFTVGAQGALTTEAGTGAISYSGTGRWATRIDNTRIAFAFPSQAPAPRIQTAQVVGLTVTPGPWTHFALYPPHSTDPRPNLVTITANRVLMAYQALSNNLAMVTASVSGANVPTSIQDFAFAPDSSGTIETAVLRTIT